MSNSTDDTESGAITEPVSEDFRSLSDSEAGDAAADCAEYPELAGVVAAQEKALLGLYIGGHPLRDVTYRAQHDPDINALTARDLPSTATDQAVRMVGAVKAFREHQTKKRQAMAFVVMEDATGEYAVTVFPMMLTMFASILIIGNCLLLEGKVSHRPEHKWHRDDEEDEEEGTTASIRNELLLDRAALWEEGALGS